MELLSPSVGALPAPAQTQKAMPPIAPPAQPSLETVLDTLAQPRLLDLYRLFGCEVRDAASSKDRLVRKLATTLQGGLPRLLREVGRDELRSACRKHGLPDDARARVDLQSLVLRAAGIDPKIAAERPPAPQAEDLPTRGQIVHARHRRWLVEHVQPGESGESAVVRLVCLDDDDPGRELEVLWDLELGARVVQPETHGIGEESRLDPPSHFGAYLHALKWSAVSAADPNRFQAPFRAGIKLMAHQLAPLMKALELPRANLFIADDVGLGKTIEAGLVLQELLLRQQANYVLVVCPASICLQWCDEMQRRFGLRFEVMTRQFVAWRRRERGFGTNAWCTHNRFIISHALLRRPEYRDPLLAHLGERARKGLLILDEAHTAAPASASKYATDTDSTRTIRDLAPRFDNRLFLSATPHNGHSNSFSALLEILDPVRFTRGVPVQGRKDLESVMVRRLKRDLRELGVEQFPKRILVELALRHDGIAWCAEETSYDAETGEKRPSASHKLSDGAPSELLLSENMARYAELCAPSGGTGKLAFIHLQQRLLASPEAFARTRQAHAQGLEKEGPGESGRGPGQALSRWRSRISWRVRGIAVRRARRGGAGVERNTSQPYVRSARIAVRDACGGRKRASSARRQGAGPDRLDAQEPVSCCRIGRGFSGGSTMVRSPRYPLHRVCGHQAILCGPAFSGDCAHGRRRSPNHSVPRRHGGRGAR